MLYCVEIEVRVPPDADPARIGELRVKEKAAAEDMQRRGELRHIWRVTGRPANICIFDVTDHDRLHELLAGLPLFAFMDIAVTPLSRHPAALG